MLVTFLLVFHTFPSQFWTFKIGISIQKHKCMIFTYHVRRTLKRAQLSNSLQEYIKPKSKIWKTNFWLLLHFPESQPYTCLERLKRNVPFSRTWVGLCKIQVSSPLPTGPWAINIWCTPHHLCLCNLSTPNRSSASHALKLFSKYVIVSLWHIHYLLR